MSFRRFLLDHGLLPGQYVRMDAELLILLEGVAATQGRPVRELILDALRHAVQVNHAQAHNDGRWLELTPREQQVAALACLGYTNHEIARQLVISVNTVRSHMRNVLDKYGVTSKADLRLILADWNFEGWEEEIRN